MACSEKTKPSRMANHWVGCKEFGKRWLDARHVIEDFGFDGVGNEEPSYIFKSGGEEMGFIFGKPIFLAC